MKWTIQQLVLQADAQVIICYHEKSLKRRILLRIILGRTNAEGYTVSTLELQ